MELEEEMKTKYCLTRLQKIIPCDVGWGSASNDGVKTCQDEPVEENCHYIIDPSTLSCPYCGGWIENPFEEMIGLPR